MWPAKNGQSSPGFPWLLVFPEWPGLPLARWQGQGTPRGCSVLHLSESPGMRPRQAPSFRSQEKNAAVSKDLSARSRLRRAQPEGGLSLMPTLAPVP